MTREDADYAKRSRHWLNQAAFWTAVATLLGISLKALEYAGQGGVPYHG